jgi:hypothetical protein
MSDCSLFLFRVIQIDMVNIDKKLEKNCCLFTFICRLIDPLKEKVVFLWYLDIFEGNASMIHLTKYFRSN